MSALRSTSPRDSVISLPISSVMYPASSSRLSRKILTTFFSIFLRSSSVRRLQSLYRDTFDDLDVVAGSVLRWEQGLSRTGRARDRIHPPLDLHAIGVNVNAGTLARTHMPKLRFLEVRDAPHIVEWNDLQHRLFRLDVLAYLHGAVRDDAVHWAC